MQINEGRYFLHEHPWGAWSWRVPAMQRLMQHSQVRSVKGHMCAQGMYIEDRDGSALAFKPTGWVSNSKHVLNELNKQCINLRSNPEHYHRHADLQHGAAARASIYPEQLCYSILKGLRKQMIELGIAFEGELGTICEDKNEYELLQAIQQ